MAKVQGVVSAGAPTSDGATAPRRVHRKKETSTPEVHVPPGVPPNHVARDGTIYYPPPGHPGLPPNQRYISPAEFASMSVKDLMRYAAAPPTPEEQAAIAAHYKDYRPPPPHDPLARLGELGAEARALPIIPAELPPLSPEALAAFEARHAAFMRGERPDWNALDAEDRANADREAERIAAEAEAEAASADKGAGASKGRRGKAAPVEPTPAASPSPSPPSPLPPGVPGLAYAVPGLPLGTDVMNVARGVSGSPAQSLTRDQFQEWLLTVAGLAEGSAYQVGAMAARVWRAGVGLPKAELGSEPERFRAEVLLRWWDTAANEAPATVRMLRYSWRWWCAFWAETLERLGPGAAQGLPSLPDLPTALDMDALGTLPARFYSAVGVLAGHCPGWADPLTWQTAYWTTELGDVLVQRRAALPTFAASPEAFAALAPADRLLLYLAAVIDDLASYSAPSGWRVGQRLIPRLPYSDRCADEAVLRRVIQMSLMSPAELSGVLTAPAKRKRGRPSRWSASGGAA